jgi:hypothetical protein
MGNEELVILNSFSSFNTADGTRSFTAIGAWIILLSSAVEPFIQQIVAYENSLIYRDDGNVQISFAARWSGGTELAAPPSNYYTSNNGRCSLYLPYSPLRWSTMTNSFHGQVTVLYYTLAATVLFRTSTSTSPGKPRSCSD